MKKMEKMENLIVVYVLESLVKPASCSEAGIIKTIKMVKKSLRLSNSQAFKFYKHEVFRHCAYPSDEVLIARCSNVEQLAEARRRLSKESIAYIKYAISWNKDFCQI